MVEILTSNNVKAVVNVADFADALTLKRVFFKSLAESGLDVQKFLSGKSISIKDMDIDFDSIISAVFGLLGSKELDDAVIKCLSRSLYRGEKITAFTFDDEKARQDYYELFIKCAEINLSPFVKGLASGFKTLFPIKEMEENQKSE